MPASEEALRRLFGVDQACDLEVLPKEGVRVRKRPPAGPTEVLASVKLGRGQEYFRDAVLNNFGGRCGITRLSIRELLLASHILPWGSHPSERLKVAMEFVYRACETPRLTSAGFPSMKPASTALPEAEIRTLAACGGREFRRLDRRTAPTAAGSRYPGDGLHC